MSYTFYEFFAGGGMARAGLGDAWECLFANDFDPKKAVSYSANWGDKHLVVGDVASLTPEMLPARADLAWASFPCQDLSLAGDYAGLSGERSGTFWAFWTLMQSLARESRAPRVIVLENVYGILTANAGRDFSSLCSALVDGGYRLGAVVVDAQFFLPQSRPRVFVIATQDDEGVAAELTADRPSGAWYPPALVRAHASLDQPVKDQWNWWRLAPPAARNTQLIDLIDTDPVGVEWHSSAETEYLLSMMTDVNRSKVDGVRSLTKRENTAVVGSLYRRTRGGIQRTEVRFDGIAGCLRTPAGGSSRQVVVLVENGKVRTRLFSPREAARLMGLHDEYELPGSLNQALHLVGDGVAVPVVRHLATSLIEPMLAGRSTPTAVTLAAE